ncbi:MAG: heat-inducible transcriptional repressor HrcA [Tissierellia bacterium]|nr:heat-inducible transcriptional repressor HrcA [Tissierellia bacterium]
MLDDRKLSILYAIINSYILCAEPVGSRTISKKYDLGVSSATIRNEMSDLEGLGYLNKAHSSSGRIPSDKAYRHYVNYLLEEYFNEIAPNKTEILKLLDKNYDELESLITNSVRVLSTLTKYTALVIISNPSDIKLKKVQLIEIEPQVLVLLLVYDNDKVDHRTIRLNETIEDITLDYLNNFLNSHLVGKNLSEIPKILDHMVVEELIGYRSFLLNLKSIVDAQIKDTNETHIIYDGVANIFNYPEYKDVDKAKEFVNFLENRDSLMEALMNDSEEDLMICIGQENKIDDLNELSIISAIYGLGDNLCGRLGIIGPKRMDYSAVIMTLLALTDAIESLGSDKIKRGD